MATSGQMAKTLSEVLQKPFGTVQFYGQSLRDAGLMKVGSRGAAAGDIGEADVINWLLAVMCAETAQSAPDAVKAARRAVLVERKAEGPIEDDADLCFPRAESVGELIHALFEDELNHRLGPVGITLEFRLNIPEIELHAVTADPVEGWKWRLSMSFGPKRSKREEELYSGRYTRIGKSHLQAIGQALRTSKVDA